MHISIAFISTVRITRVDARKYVNAWNGMELRYWYSGVYVQTVVRKVEKKITFADEIKMHCKMLCLEF